MQHIRLCRDGLVQDNLGNLGHDDDRRTASVPRKLRTREIYITALIISLCLSVID